MLEDLKTDILSWQEEGDKIILLIDANDHLEGGLFINGLEDVGLRERIIQRHRDEWGIEPTHKTGSYPIDGIFTSPDINITAGGYLLLGDAPSDHRALWIDTHEAKVFGYKPGKIISPTIRRLQHNNPRIVKKWIQSYEEYVREHRLHETAFDIQKQIQMNRWNEVQQERFENLLIDRIKGIIQADKNCRKLHMGEVPWS